MSPHVDTPQSFCRFGLAQADVTPPVGIYHRMWGAATHDRSTGVHRPLTATAMAFGPLGDEGRESNVEDRPNESEQGASSDIRSSTLDLQVLVALDHCLLWAAEMDRLLATVCAANGLAREQVAVTFSHTHGAGLMGLERTELPGGDLIAPYLEQLGETVARLVAEARRNMQPVTIAYGTGRCDLATHRDSYDPASGQWVCGFNPRGPVDDTVLVARITDDADRLVATVVNYGCHPTTLAWENTLISPDYPGAMRETVARVTGAPCEFLLGACGDVGPREGYVGDVAVADRNGRQLGYAVLSALESLPPPRTRFVYAGPVVSGATLGIWRHEPLGADAAAMFARFRVRRWMLELPYPAGEPTAAQIETDRQRWQRDEEEALAAGRDGEARDCHAMVERQNRALARLRNRPPGERFPYLVTLWQMGAAIWLAVEGEPYQQLQTELRRRYPGAPLLVAVLANGWRCSYLPPAGIYGTGIYQETVAVLAPGCLETVIDEVGQQIASWTEDRVSVE